MSGLVLSSGQAAAMDMLGSFLGQDEHRVAVVSGWAGTGKTSCLSVMEEHFGQIKVLAPTGKASLRVTEATGLPASTIHRFLYRADDHPETGEPIFSLRESPEIQESVGNAFVLVDEASMVDQKVWGDLLTVATVADFKIVLMGDRFQLPPVSKGDEALFCALDVPTPFSINLTEIVRQALDSPIIRASMLLRTGKPEYQAMALLEAIPASKLIQSVIDIRSRGGTVLVHRNKTRHMINTEVRKALGYEAGTIQPGEPLLVTQNSYALERYNGEIVTFNGWEQAPDLERPTAVLDRYSQVSMELTYGIALVEGGVAMMAPQEVVGKTEEAKLGLKAIRRYAGYFYRDRLALDQEDKGPPYLHTNYGYALTVNKAQGSEYPEVLVVMEPSLAAMGPIEQRRWKYTAVTRGKTKVSYLHLKD